MQAKEINFQRRAYQLFTHCKLVSTKNIQAILYGFKNLCLEISMYIQIHICVQ